MWRWSYSASEAVGRAIVFSTYVEVIPYYQLVEKSGHCILHVCGGDPVDNSSLGSQITYSPRMWRWSPLAELHLWHQCVFSTYVEVIPSPIFTSIKISSILHVCGGDPDGQTSLVVIVRYSPRMWRWSYSHFWSISCSIVFSTYVEVILT